MTDKPEAKHDPTILEWATTEEIVTELCNRSNERIVVFCLRANGKDTEISASDDIGPSDVAAECTKFLSIFFGLKYS